MKVGNPMQQLLDENYQKFGVEMQQPLNKKETW